MKKIITISFLTLASHTLLSATCTNANSLLSPFAAGDGSEDNPYLICSTAQFNNIGVNAAYMSKNFELGKNLNFNYGSFVEIAGKSVPFTGSFDGRNKTLSNVLITTANSSNDYFTHGIFRSTNNAEIKRLKVSGVKNIQYTAYQFGVIVGSAVNTDISKIKITGANLVMGDYSGVVAGQAEDTDFTNIDVSQSSVESLDTSDAVGGMVGYLHDSCIVKAKIEVANVLHRGDWGVSCIGGGFGVMLDSSLHKVKVKGSIAFAPIAPITMANFGVGSGGYGSVAGCGDEIGQCSQINPKVTWDVNMSTVIGVGKNVGSPIGLIYQ